MALDLLYKACSNYKNSLKKKLSDVMWCVCIYTVKTFIIFILDQIEKKSIYLIYFKYLIGKRHIYWLTLCGQVWPILRAQYRAKGEGSALINNLKSWVTMIYLNPGDAYGVARTYASISTEYSILWQLALFIFHWNVFFKLKWKFLSLFK